MVRAQVVAKPSDLDRGPADPAGDPRASRAAWARNVGFGEHHARIFGTLRFLDPAFR